MTEEYKNNILNYVTNTLNRTNPSNEQVLSEITSKSKTEYNGFLPSSWQYFSVNVIQSSFNGYFILYGGYVPSGSTPETDSRGIIMILDETLNPIQTIYEFSSGTRLRPIQKMIQLEDGTFVGIDSTIFSTSINRSGIQNNEKRFIMLNNFSEKGKDDLYTVRLRTSYKIPSAYQNFYCLDIVKNPNSAHYLLAGATYIPVGSGHYDGVRIIDFKINVGSSNTWINTEADRSLYWIYGGFYGEFDSNDNSSWKVILTNRRTNAVNLGWWNGTVYTVILNEVQDVEPYVDSLAMSNQAVFIDEDTAYFVINNQRWGSAVVPRYIGLYKYSFSTSSLKEIFLKEIGSFDYYSSREGIFLTTLNGDLYINYCNNYNYDNKTANYNYQRLENDVWNPILISENKSYSMENTFTLTFNVFNLVSNVILNQTFSTRYWCFDIIKEIYNKQNYNSLEYVDYNSLIANSGTIYSDNKLVFARNLYNKTTYNNITTSTIQIPSGYLNDITMEPKNLISYTNNLIVSDTNEFSKNRYENVLLNFINALNVIDEDKNILYPNSANYINENINTGTQTNYENTAMTKIRINFSDGSVVQPIEWEDISENGTIAKQTMFSVYVSSELLSIDFINEEEDFIYISKDYDFEVGNIYTVTQKVRIE